MKIIPAIDILNGKCVRLQKGDYTKQTIYSDSPLEVAKHYEDAGFTHLHVVDLDGAQSKDIVNLKTIEAICSQTNLKVDFGGGIKTLAAFERMLNMGVQQINLGSIAVNEPDSVLDWIQRFGPDCIILCADVNDQKIATDGWQKTSCLDLFGFIQAYYKMGIRHVLCTDIAKDGMLSGPSFQLYKAIQTQLPDLHLTASGGVSCLDDLIKLKEMQLHAVVVGKAIYEQKVTLAELLALTN